MLFSAPVGTVIYCLNSDISFGRKEKQSHLSVFENVTPLNNALVFVSFCLC